MQTETQTVADVVEALGGTKAVATLCDVGNTTVVNWRTWDAFPDRASLMGILEDACREHRISLDRRLFRKAVA